MNLKDAIQSEIRRITEKMDKINEANLNTLKLSTPFSHIRSTVKPKEEIKNGFMTDLSHQDNNQVLMKEDPQLKEWPTFTGEVDIKSSNKPFIKKDKPREPFKLNKPNSKEKQKCHKCGGIGHLANNCLKKAIINEIVETDDPNDKEEESDSEKDTEESETSESNEIDIINPQINNIYLIYEVLDVNSDLPQVGTSDTSRTNIQDSKLYRTKPAKVMGYTAENSSIGVVMVENQEEKLSLDTGAYFKCVGKSYLE
ncbi:hypothetical protein O181_079865 [Austropuccinia psidii MF-1]|uniref:CCHC-type domain-containing protein n=1 Tax=Austropuccinia psidii MF-1 TaxID=1389203 RepID=A0A9Q3FFT0_9BASI|nr:hypothetical protein [Austropuccinia psidii MF-1]